MTAPPQTLRAILAAPGIDAKTAALAQEHRLDIELGKVNTRIADLVRRRRELVNELHAARVAAGLPTFCAADEVTMARMFVAVIGEEAGAELAAYLLRYRPPLPRAGTQRS